MSYTPKVLPKQTKTPLQRVFVLMQKNAIHYCLYKRLHDGISKKNPHGHKVMRIFFTLMVITMKIKITPYIIYTRAKCLQTQKSFPVIS